jgi:hypothetical protein
MGASQGLQRLAVHKEQAFPRLALSDYEVTSEETVTAAKVQYNCIAHAAGDQTRKWACPVVPLRGYYWPPGARYGDEIEALVSAFEAIGYKVCGDDGTLEDGFEKVAIYMDKNKEWTHAARQRLDGHWSSKLGDWEDIRHANVMDVGDGEYGSVYCYMKRELKK